MTEIHIYMHAEDKSKKYKRLQQLISYFKQWT